MMLSDVPLNTKVRLGDIELLLIDFDCTCGVLLDEEKNRNYVRKWMDVEIVEVEK